MLCLKLWSIGLKREKLLESNGISEELNGFFDIRDSSIMLFIQVFFAFSEFVLTLGNWLEEENKD